MAANVPKAFLMLCCVKLITSGTITHQTPETPSRKSGIDMEDVDMVIKSERLLNNYIKCILDVGPCTAAGQEIRMNIPEAIVTNCDRCTKDQIKTVRKVVTFISMERPQDWEKILKKFDPQGKYREQFEKFLKIKM